MTVTAALLNQCATGKPVFSPDPFDFTLRIPFVIGPNGMTDMAPIFPNWAVDSTAGAGEETIGNDVTVTCEIEYSGVSHPAPFPSGTTVTIADGDSAQVLPITGVDFTAGDTAYLRYRIVGTGNYAQSGLQTPGITFQAGDHVHGTGALSGGPEPDSFQPWCYPIFPGTSTDALAAPIIAIQGDSTSLGYQDPVANRGFIRYALGNDFPSMAVGCINETVGQFIATHGKRISLLEAVGVRYVVCTYPINDIVAARSTAAIQADLLAMWTLDAAISTVRGVYQCTPLPWTSSTNGWADTAGQTDLLAGAKQAVRQAILVWLRGGAPILAGVAVSVGTPGALVAGDVGHPLAGVFDTATIAESAPGSGLWVGGSITPDGRHPGTGVPAIAAAIDTSLFAPVGDPPIVTTGRPTIVTQTTATLTALINPNDFDALVDFQWGTTTAYGNTTGTQDVGSGSDPVAAATAITGLTPNTTYHYRAVAMNANGVTNGADQTFTTPRVVINVMAERASGLLQYLNVSPASDRLRDLLVRAMLEPAERLSLICHGDGQSYGPWEAVTNPAVAPLWGLPYAAQWVGALMPARLNGESDEDYTDRARQELLHPRGFTRGSAQSLKIVAQAYLTGAKTCHIVPILGGNIWQVGVLVFEASVTDLDALTAAVNDDHVAIGGMQSIVEFLSSVEWIVSEFEETGMTVAAFEAAFASVADFEAFEVDS